MPLISDSSKHSIAYQTFLGLKEAGINYCVWKSIDRFDEGARGATDFDLLVSSACQDKLFCYLKEHHWLEVKAEKWRTFPEVYDFLLYDETLKEFLHFHIHFQLVMGDRRLKNLTLPLADLYLERKIEVEGIFTCMPELEFAVFILRIAVKVDSLDYWLLRLKGGERAVFEGFKKEYEQLVARVDGDRLTNLLGIAELTFVPSAFVTEAYKDFSFLNLDRCKTTREKLIKYRRYQGWQRWYMATARFFQRRLCGIGKSLPKEGKMFTVCGCDGSGKTTIIKALGEKLSGHLKIKHYYLGGSPGSKGFCRFLFRLIAFPVYALLWRLIDLIQGENKSIALKKYFYGIEEYLIAREKYSRYQKALHAKKTGALVIFERFPIFPGVGDGIVEDQNAPFYKKLEKLYSSVGDPGTVFCLPVDAQKAVTRKPDHDIKVVQQKAERFNSFFKAKTMDPQFIVLEDELEVDRKISTIISHIMQEVHSDH
ncbi:ATP-binding protein [Oligoflexia bacterium]|nr:ATP-binding protein [Oligoflexia bacterium]